MNTSKQVNIMIGLLFLAFVTFGGYIAWEPTRSSDAEDSQAELFAERGATIFVANCRGCHGLDGEGHIGPSLGGPAGAATTNAFLVLGEENEYGVDATPDGEADGIRSFLHNTISCGRTGTFMPVWAQEQGGALSRIQVDYMVELITSARWDLVEEIGFEHDLESNHNASSQGVLARLGSGAVTLDEAVAELNALGATGLAGATDVLARLEAKELGVTAAFEELDALGLQGEALAFGRGIYGRLSAGDLTAEEAVAAWIELGMTDSGIARAHDEGLLTDAQLEEIFRSQVLVKAADAPALAITTSNCGQYNAAALAEARSRDPLTAKPPPSDGTAEPTATSTPGGGDSGAEDAMVQGMVVREFFAARCSPCHGMNRQGGVGLPLTRDRLTEPDQFYIDTITNGRGAIMPAWGQMGLTEEEIASIVVWLKNTDP